MTPKRWAVAVALVALLAAAGAIAPTPAGAQTTSRAVVVVDLGSLGGGVHTSVIEFSGTVSGLEALQRAGASPSTITYGPLGQAVCQLFGAGDAPVPGQCPGGWVYFRASGGAGGWTQSSLGASNTAVHDGDVEGWRYGGGAPPFQSFCAVAGCAPAPAPETAAPVAAPAGGGTTSGGLPSSGPVAGGGSTSSAAGDAGSGSATPTTATPGTPDGAATKNGDGKGTTAEAGAGGPQQRVTRAVRPATASASDDGGGSPVGVVVAVVVVAALVGGGLLLRRRRAGT